MKALYSMSKSSALSVAVMIYTRINGSVLNVVVLSANSASKLRLVAPERGASFIIVF